MKIEHVRVLSAAAGGFGVVAMGLFGLSLGGQSTESGPSTVLAPATGTVAGISDSVTTTSWAPSFRPVVTATIPPPPTD